jgi:hypothetical protein
VTAVVDRLAEWKPELHPRDKHGRFRDAWKIAGRGAAVLDRVLRGIRPKTWGSEAEATSDLTQQLKKQRRRTPAQDASLKYFFSQEGNWDIQSALRANADLRKPGGPSAHIKNLDDAMRPTEQDMILTHVTGFSPFGTSAQNPDEVDEWTGKLISDLGYMSTSAQYKQMPGNPNDPPHVTMSLLVPRGTRAVIRGDGGSVVLDRHQPVRIIKVTDDGHGGKYIHAVVMPQVGGGEAPRALGTALRPQEKSPAIEATPEELARRGLNPEGVPIPHVPTGVPAGEQPAMGPHTPSPEQPAGPPSTEKPTEAIKRAGTEVPRGAGRVNRPEDLTGAEAPPAKERGGKQVESPEAARLREQQRQLDQQQARVERQQARVAQSQQRLADQQAQLIKQQQAQIDHLVGQQQAPAAPEAPPAKGPRVKALGTDRFDRWADTKAPEWTPEEKWNRDSGVLRAAQRIQDRGGPQHEEDQRILDHAEAIRRERSGEAQRGEIAPPPEVKAPEAPPAKATRAARMRKAAPAAAPEEQPAKPEAPTAPVKKAARAPIATRLKPAEEEKRLKAVEEVAKQQEEKASARQELARLKHEAGQRKIPGRSKMSPEELRNAIAEHDRRQQEGAPEAPAAPVEKAIPEAPAAPVKKAVPAAPEATPEAPKAEAPETPEMRVARRNRELGNGREARDQAYLDLPRAEKDDIIRRADAIPEGERRRDTQTGILVRAADLIKADDEKHGRRPARAQEPQPESQIGRARAVRQAKEAQAQPAEKAAEEAPKSAVDKLLAERTTLRTREERQQRISQLSEADKTEIVRRADAIEKAHTGDEHFLKTMASKIRRERGEPEPNLISLPERRPVAGEAPPETHISPEGRRVSFPGRKTEEQQKAREEAARTAEGIRERQNDEKRAKLREPARRRLQRFEEEFPEWKRDDTLKKARQKIIDGRPMTEVRKDLETESVHRENMSEREQKYPDEAVRYKEMSDRYQEAADSLGKRLPTKKRAPGEEKQQSMAALKREASDLKVPGRSTMERAELEKAVAARRRKEGETEAAHAARVAELNKPKKVAPGEIDVNKATLVQLRQIADEQGMPKRGRPTRKEEMRAWVKQRQEPGFQEPPPVPTVAEKRAAAKAAKAAAEAPAKKPVPVRPVDHIEEDLAAKRITKAQAVEQLRANGSAHGAMRADELEGKKPEAAAPAKALRTAAKKAVPAPKELTAAESRNLDEKQLVQAVRDGKLSPDNAGIRLRGLARKEESNGNNEEGARLRQVAADLTGGKAPAKPTVTREAAKKVAAREMGKALPARFRNKTIDAYTPEHRSSFGPNLDLTTKAGQDVAVADAARRATLPLSGLHTAIEGDASKTAKLHHLKGLERAGIRPELLQGMRDAVASGDKKKMQAEERKLLRALDLEQVGQIGETVPLDRELHRPSAGSTARAGNPVEVIAPGYRLRGGPVVDHASVIRTPQAAAVKKAAPTAPHYRIPLTAADKEIFDAHEGGSDYLSRAQEAGFTWNGTHAEVPAAAREDLQGFLGLREEIARDNLDEERRDPGSLTAAQKKEYRDTLRLARKMQGVLGKEGEPAPASRTRAAKRAGPEMGAPAPSAREEVPAGKLPPPTRKGLHQIRLPDGTMAERTSATRNYTHAVMVTENNEERAKATEATIQQIREATKAFEEAVRTGDYSKFRRVSGGGNSYHTDYNLEYIPSARKSSDPKWLQGILFRSPLDKDIDGERAYDEKQIELNKNRPGMSRMLDYTPGLRDAFGKGNDEVRKFRVEQAKQEKAKQIKELEERVKQYRSLPPESHYIARWSSSPGGARQAANDKGLIPSGNGYSHRIVAVGDDLSGGKVAGRVTGVGHARRAPRINPDLQVPPSEETGKALQDLGIDVPSTKHDVESIPKADIRKAARSHGITGLQGKTNEELLQDFTKKHAERPAPVKKAAPAKKAAKAAVPEKPKITKAGFDAKATRAKLESAKTRDEAKQALDGLTIAQLREVSPEGTRGGRTKADMVHRVVELHAGGRLEGEALRGLAPGGKPEPTKAGAANPPELGGEGPHGPAAWISRMRRAPTEGKIASNPDDIKTGQFIYRDSSGWGHVVGGPEKDRYQGEVYRVVFPNDQGGPGQYSRKVSTAEVKKSIEEHAKLKDYAEKRNAAGATDGGWTPGHGPQAAKPTITKKAAPAKATAPEAPRVEFPRSLDTATKRKAYVAEQAKMSLDDFHALPQEKRDEIIKNLRDIGNHNDVPRATRDSMGSLVRGATRSPHNDRAKFLAKHLSEPYTPKPVRPAKAASTEEALARIRAIPADSKNPNEAIDHALTGMTNREIGKVAAEGGWYERGGYDVRGQTRASLIERIRQGTHPTAPHVAERTTPEEVTPALTRPSATRAAKAAPELPKARHISADEISKALHEENTRSLNLERARTRAAEIDTPAAQRVVKNYEKGLLTEEDLKNELDLAEAEKAKAAPAKKAVAAVERTTPEAVTPSLTKAAPAKRVAKKAAKAAAPEAGPEEAPPLEERTQPKMLLAEAKQRSAHDAITGHSIFHDSVDGKAARQLADGIQEKRLSPTIAYQKAQKISTEAARRASVSVDEGQARRWSRVANDYQDLANAIRDSQSTVSLDRYRFGHRGPEMGAPAPAAFHEGELSPAGRFVELRREAMRTEGEPNVGGLSDTQLHGIDEILKKDAAEGKVKPFDRHVRAAIDKELVKRAGTAAPAKKALPPASRQLPGASELENRVQKELDLAGGTRVHRLVQAQMGGDNNSASDVRRRAELLRAEAAKLHASRRRSVAGHREDTLDGDKLQQAAETFDRHADMLDKRRAAAAERIAPRPAKKVAAPRALTPRQQEVADAKERLALRRLQAENRDIPTRGKSADRLEAEIKAHDEGLRKPAAKKVAAKAIPVAEKAAPTKAVPAKKVAAKAAAPEEASIDRPDIKAIADRLPDRYKQQISKILSGGSAHEPMRSKVQKAAALRRDAAFMRESADSKYRVLPHLPGPNEDKVQAEAIADHLDRIADLVYLRPGTTKSRKKLPEIRKTLDERLHEAKVGGYTNEPGYKDILAVRQERGATNLKAADVRRRAQILRDRAQELRTAHERHGKITGKKVKPRPEDIAHAQELEKAAKVFEEHAASLPDANVPEKPAREPRVTKAHLMDRARQLDIPGRSKMSTDELKAAVAEREKGPEVGAPAPSAGGLPEGPAVPRRHTFQISRSTAADTGRTAGDQPLRLPNGGSDQGRLHLDSEIGQLWTDLVSDKREPNSRLNNITRIGEDVGTGKMSLDEAAGELRKMAKTAPDRAVARRLEHAADAITAGPTPKIESPEGTPPAVHKFLQDLAAIPTMRKKDPLHPNEVTVLERARRLVQDAHNNPTATSDFQREVPKLAPHESVDGGYEAQRIVHRFASAAREDPSVRRWLHAEPPRGEFKVGEAPKAAAPKGERLMPHNDKMSPEGQKLDAMSYEERVANLKKFTRSGPDYQRRTVDSLDRAAHFHRQGDGQATNAQLIEAEIAAKQRPEGDWQHRYPEEPKTHVATPAAAPEAPKKATTPSAGHQERLREAVTKARARLTPAQKQEAADQRERLRLARLQAGNRNIRGRSKMNVDQLEAAIAEHDKNEAAKKAAAEAKKAAPTKAVRAAKKAAPPKEETPLSQDELHAIRDLSHKGNFTDNGWVHHDQLNETQRKHLDSLAGKGYIDKHGTGDNAMYRIKPGQGRGGEKGGVLTGEIVPQQKEHGSQLSTDKVNRGGLIHGYMTSDGHFTNELKDASAEEKKAKRVRVIVQRTEHVGADGKPVEGLFNQTHARIIGHDADTGKRIESKVLPRGSSWDWEFNPTEQTSADIEGTATETPERKAVAAAKAAKKAAPKADWTQSAPDAAAFRAMPKDEKLRALRKVAESVGAEPGHGIPQRSWARHVLSELPEGDLRELVNELADISNWGTSEKHDKGQLAQVIINLTGLNPNGRVDTAHGPTSFNERLAKAAKKAAPQAEVDRIKSLAAEAGITGDGGGLVGARQLDVKQGASRSAVADQIRRDADNLEKSHLDQNSSDPHVNRVAREQRAHGVDSLRRWADLVEGKPTAKETRAAPAKKAAPRAAAKPTITRSSSTLTTAPQNQRDRNRLVQAGDNAEQERIRVRAQEILSQEKGSPAAAWRKAIDESHERSAAQRAAAPAKKAAAVKAVQRSTRGGISMSANDQAARTQGFQDRTDEAFSKLREAHGSHRPSDEVLREMKDHAWRLQGSSGDGRSFMFAPEDGKAGIAVHLPKEEGGRLTFTPREGRFTSYVGLKRYIQQHHAEAMSGGPGLRRKVMAGEPEHLPASQSHAGSDARIKRALEQIGVSAHPNLEHKPYANLTDRDIERLTPEQRSRLVTDLRRRVEAAHSLDRKRKFRDLADRIQGGRPGTTEAPKTPATKAVRRAVKAAEPSRPRAEAPKTPSLTPQTGAKEKPVIRNAQSHQELQDIAKLTNYGRERYRVHRDAGMSHKEAVAAADADLTARLKETETPSGTAAENAAKRLTARQTHNRLARASGAADVAYDLYQLYQARRKNDNPEAFRTGLRERIAPHPHQISPRDHEMLGQEEFKKLLGDEKSLDTPDKMEAKVRDSLKKLGIDVQGKPGDKVPYDPETMSHNLLGQNGAPKPGDMVEIQRPAMTHTDQDGKVRVLKLASVSPVRGLPEKVVDDARFEQAIAGGPHIPVGPPGGTPDDGLEKKTMRELRAMLPADRRAPTRLKKAELISMVRDEQGTGTHHASMDSEITALRDSARGGKVKVKRKLGDGTMGQVDLVQGSGRREMVRKQVLSDPNPQYDISAKEQTDSENIVSRMARAFGIKGTPAVYQQGDHTVYMDRVRGKLASESSAEDVRRAIESPQGRRLAILDLITGQTDRNDDNWMIVKDENGDPIPVPIDNSLAFRKELRRRVGEEVGPAASRRARGEIAPSGQSPYDRFLRYWGGVTGTREPTEGASNLDEKWADEHSFPKGELQEIQRELTKLKPEFYVQGKDGVWHYLEAQSRLQALIKRAKDNPGPPSHTPGEGLPAPTHTMGQARAARVVARTPQRGDHFLAIQDMLDEDTPEGGIPVHEINLDITATGAPTETYHVLHGTVHRHNGVTTLVEHPDTPAGRNGAAFAYKRLRKYQESLSREDGGIQTGYAILQDDNPQDSHWSNKYGLEGFFSAATGGRGSVWLWRQSVYPFREGDLDHEFGHNVEWSVPERMQSSGARWHRSGRLDDAARRKVTDFKQTFRVSEPHHTIRTHRNASGKYPDGVTNYGTSSPSEDFAESQMLYRAGVIGEGRLKPGGPIVPIWFRDLYPERAKMIDEMFPEMARQQLATIQRLRAEGAYA